MQRGVVYGVLAGALWGMVFLVPRLLTDFSPLLLSAGRYTMYGLVSLAAALPGARSRRVRGSRAHGASNRSGARGGIRGGSPRRP